MYIDSMVKMFCLNIRSTGITTENKRSPTNQRSVWADQVRRVRSTSESDLPKQMPDQGGPKRLPRMPCAEIKISLGKCKQMEESLRRLIA